MERVSISNVTNFASTIDNTQWQLDTLHPEVVEVDVLNEDMPTLRCLQRNNLYRNYIWREVSGIGSTGLREESYDVVVTSGGFSSNAMSPNDITEVSKREKCFHSE